MPSCFSLSDNSADSLKFNLFYISFLKHRTMPAVTRRQNRFATYRMRAVKSVTARGRDIKIEKMINS